MSLSFTSLGSSNCGLKIVILIHRWEYMNAEDLLDTLFYAILCKGLGHLFWCLWGVLEPVPCGY